MHIPAQRLRIRELRLILGLLAALAPAVMAGCATTSGQPFVWINDLPPTAGEVGGTIQPRDTIAVVVMDQPSLSGEFIVHDDGTYLQPTLGNLSVKDKTPQQVVSDLSVRLKDFVVNLRVNVSIIRVATIRVSVVGEVKTPGTYELTRDRSVAGALAAAGWLTDFAARDRVFVARQGANHPRIRFPLQDVTAPESRAALFRLRDGDVVVVE